MLALARLHKLPRNAREYSLCLRDEELEQPVSSQEMANDESCYPLDRRWKHHVWWLFLAALMVRAGFIVFFHVAPGLSVEYQHDREAEHFADILVREGAFTNPYVPDGSMPSALRSP